MNHKLQADQFLDSYQPDPSDRGEKCHLPVLRSLLEFAPNPQCLSNICVEIISCTNDQGLPDSSKLRELSKRYQNVLLIPMNTSRGRAPDVSVHPSRLSAEEREQDIAGQLEVAKRDPGRLKRLVLRRDNYRCVISGKPDMALVKKGKVRLENGEEPGSTEAAHILPFSLARTRDGTNEIDRKSRVWEVIAQFGNIHFEELNGNQINRVENVMTLSATPHKLFGDLDIWLTSVENQENTYILRTASWVQNANMGLEGKRITFTTTNPAIGVPDPRYLALHAACAQVWHASGMAEYVENILEDMEELRVLPEDGCSDVLMFALQSVAVC